MGHEPKTYNNYYFVRHHEISGVCVGESYIRGGVSNMGGGHVPPPAPCPPPPMLATDLNSTSTPSQAIIELR